MSEQEAPQPFDTVEEFDAAMSKLADWFVAENLAMQDKWRAGLDDLAARSGALPEHLALASIEAHSKRAMKEISNG